MNRNVTKIEEQLSCSGYLAFNARNRWSWWMVMMTGKRLIAQQSLKMLKTKITIDGALDETVLEMLFQ